MGKNTGNSQNYFQNFRPVAGNGWQKKYSGEGAKDDLHQSVYATPGLILLPPPKKNPEFAPPPLFDS